jgi:hypothetical protein
MKSQKSFKGWNFRTIWDIDSNINEGYPYLITGNIPDSFGSFWFIAVLLIVVVLMAIGVVYLLLKKRFAIAKTSKT